MTGMTALLLSLSFLLQTPRTAPPPRGVVEGRLLSSNGTPLAAARVAAVSVEAVGAPGNSMTASLAQTDSSGRFRLEDIPPGRYYIQVGLVDEPFFFPGTRSRDKANVVTLTPGATVIGIDFVVDSTQIQPRRVTGRLVLESPLPPLMANSRLTLTLSNGRQQGRATVGADGSFEIPSLRGGEYMARLDPPVPITPATVTIDDNDAPLEFRAPAVYEIAGNIVVEGGGPLPTLSMTFSGPMTGNAPRIAAGGFRSALVAGEYSVVLGGLTPGFFLKSVRADTNGAESPRLIVTGPHTEVTVTLGVSDPPPWHTVSGRVIGLGTSAGNMLIALTNPSANNVPAAMSTSPAAAVNYARAVDAAKAEGLTAQLNRDGSFEIPRVLPGNYNARIALIATTSEFFFVNQPEVPAIAVSDRDVKTQLSVPMGDVVVTRDLSARVIVEGGGPMPRVTVRRPSGGAASTVTPRPDGVVNLPAAFGEVSVYLGEMPAGYVLKSLTYGSTDLLRNSTAAIDGTTGELRITLGPSGPRAWVKVTGRVRGLEQGSSARLLLTPTSPGSLTPVPPFPALSLPALAKLLNLSIAAPAAYSISVKPDGTFELPAVLQGNYRLTVSVRSADGAVGLNTEKTIAVGSEDLAEVEIRIPTLSAVRGQIVADGGNLPRDFRLVLTGGAAPMMVYPTVEADGSFLVKLPEGNYRLAAGALPEGYRTKSVRYGEADAFERPATIRAGEAPKELRVNIGRQP